MSLLLLISNLHDFLFILEDELEAVVKQLGNTQLLESDSSSAYSSSSNM